MQIINKDNVQERNREANGYIISGGIVVVLESAVIPDGSILWYVWTTWLSFFYFSIWLKQNVYWHFLEEWVISMPLGMSLNMQLTIKFNSFSDFLQLWTFDTFHTFYILKLSYMCKLCLTNDHILGLRKGTNFFPKLVKGLFN